MPSHNLDNSVAIMPSHNLQHFLYDIYQDFGLITVVYFLETSDHSDVEERVRRLNEVLEREKKKAEVLERKKRKIKRNQAKKEALKLEIEIKVCCKTFLKHCL